LRAVRSGLPADVAEFASNATRPRILLLCGSLADPSHTLTTLLLVQERLDASGAATTLWNVRDRPLPVADVRYQGRELENPAPLAHELTRLAAAADGYVLGSPVYHNSYSGALKNALDTLGPAQFRHKPVAFVSNGGGMRSVQPLDHLRIVIRALAAIGTPTHVATTGADFAPEPDAPGGYRLIADDALARVAALAEELLWFAERLRQR
jgi:NAD(P)H-dependent FMN reductase